MLIATLYLRAQIIFHLLLCYSDLRGFGKIGVYIMLLYICHLSQYRPMGGCTFLMASVNCTFTRAVSNVQNTVVD